MYGFGYTFQFSQMIEKHYSSQLSAFLIYIQSFVNCQACAAGPPIVNGGNFSFTSFIGP